MKWHMFIGLLISGIKVFYEGCNRITVHGVYNESE